MVQIHHFLLGETSVWATILWKALSNNKHHNVPKKLWIVKNQKKKHKVIKQLTPRSSQVPLLMCCALIPLMLHSSGDRDLSWAVGSWGTGLRRATTSSRASLTSTPSFGMQRTRDWCPNWCQITTCPFLRASWEIMEWLENSWENDKWRAYMWNENYLWKMFGLTKGVTTPGFGFIWNACSIIYRSSSASHVYRFPPN